MTVGEKAQMWRRRFSRIYCIHNEEDRERLPRLMWELERVGIVDSGLLEMRVTSPNVADGMLMKLEGNSTCACAGYANLALATRRMLSEALYFGHERILVLEDDVAFLKDEEAIRELLNEAPWEYDIIQFEKLVGSPSEWKRRVAENRIREKFIDGGGWYFASGACYSLSRRGMEEIERAIGERLQGMEEYFYMVQERGCTYAVALQNMTVQVMYRRAKTQADEKRRREMEFGYILGGVHYRDYNVPAEYTLGSVYVEDGLAVEKARRLEAEWRRRFDRVYCIHYLPNERKLRRLRAELRRVGIEGSGLLEWRYTSPNPHDDILFKSGAVDRLRCQQKGYLNETLEFERILSDALERGYERILFVENDMAFLRDGEEIRRMLDDVPEGYDIVQFDKFVLPQVEGTWQRMLREHRINERYVLCAERSYTGSGCVALSRRGMENVRRELQEREKKAVDLAIATAWLHSDMKLRYVVAVKNMAVQLLYSDAANLVGREGVEGISLVHDAYARGGVDYAEYEVPEGYGRGSVIVKS